MKIKIDTLRVPTTKKVELFKEYRLRGIEETKNSKMVVAEKSYCLKPTANEIAEFLIYNPNADFCVIEECYSIE